MRKTLKIAAATAALAMVVTGCGSDSGGGGGSSDRLDGVSVTVGSKDFTENILLAEMFAQALENEGASVNNKVNLGGTSVNRDALTSGDIDVYPEYNGTGWTVHLGNEDPEPGSAGAVRRHRRRPIWRRTTSSGSASRRSTTPMASPPTAISPRPRADSTSRRWPTT